MRWTTQGLRERVSWLEEELRAAHKELARLEEAERRRKPKQEPLPGVPQKQRQRSVHEENFAEFQASRRSKLDRLGVPFVEDERNEPAFVVARLKEIRDACSSDAELFELFRLFFADSWAARCTPPYPFRAFAAEKVWTKLLFNHRQSGGSI
jgi:hypothetical protein